MTRIGFGFLAVIAAGCDPLERLDIVITVPAAVQAGFDEASPGQVLLTIAPTDGDPYATSEAVVCAPGEDFDVALYFGGVGCSEERTITAWLEPLRVDTDDAGEPIPCGIGSFYLADAALTPPEGAPVASVVAFPGNDHCQSDTESYALTLE